MGAKKSKTKTKVDSADSKQNTTNNKQTPFIIKPTTNNANWMSNKLYLLISGYVRTICIYKKAPNDIIELLCKLWIIQSPQPVFNKYYYAPTSLPLEIYLELKDSFALKILSSYFINIAKYQINYIKLDGFRQFSTGFDTHSFLEKNKAKIKHLFLTIIYETNCVSFTRINDINFNNSCNALIQVIVIDKNNDIISKSKWRTINVNVSSVTHHDDDYNYVALQKYFNEIICGLSNSKCININRWVYFLKEKNLETDEFEARKIFHFILFLNKQKECKMYYDDFRNFVCDDSYEEYKWSYCTYISYFRKEIPDFVDDRCFSYTGPD